MKCIRPGLVLAAAALTVLSFTTSASAQTYGSVTVYPGSPTQTMYGTSGGIVGQPGGEIAASNYGTTSTGPCRGYIAAAPDHTINVTGQASVTIAANATDGGDTTLVVMGPSGTFCNDDSNGFQPALTASLAPGVYNVWVGSYGQGSNHPYSITVSGGAGGGTGQAGGGGAYGLQTTGMVPADPMGTIYLSPGFLPDPQTRSGTTGGTVDASMIPNNYGGTCRGMVASQPDHIMVLNAPFSHLGVHVTSGGDPTLVIQDPNGTFWCNDDASGLQPAITGPWTAGTWRIWVGDYRGDYVSYSIDFTEYQR